MNFCFTEARTLEQDEFYGFVDDRQDWKGLMEDTLSVYSNADRIAGRFDVAQGGKYSKNLWGEDTSIIKKLFAKILEKGSSYKVDQGDAFQMFKDELQVYEKDPETKKKVPRYTDYEFKRLIRTEFAKALVIKKLLEWKALGFKKVKHKTRISPNSGEKDIAMNGRVFEIDYLLSKAGDKDRAPLHPQCRCTYIVYE